MWWSFISEVIENETFMIVVMLLMVSGISPDSDNVGALFAQAKGSHGHRRVHQEN